MVGHTSLPYLATCSRFNLSSPLPLHARRIFLKNLFYSFIQNSSEVPVTAFSMKLQYFIIYQDTSCLIWTHHLEQEPNHSLCLQWSCSFVYVACSSMTPNYCACCLSPLSRIPIPTSTPLHTFLYKGPSALPCLH